MTAWKLARDPFLFDAGEAAALEAGFFFDEDPADAPLDDVDWLCTPTEIARRAAGERPVVLLSTGAFFPIHAGHLAMMERGRAAARAAGLNVVAGYLSLAHDDYVRLKRGRVDVPVSERLARAAAAVAPSGWLSVDPWEALARRVSVNYTDVVARLERYLRHHLRPDLDVWFVCGGDNARFALAFARRGRCIVVGRPGSEAEVARWRADGRLAGPDRLLWADGDDPSASSALLPEAHPAVTRIALRIEDEGAVATLGLPPERWRAFQAGLRHALQMRVEPREQNRPGPFCSLSLDPLAPGAANLAVSRLFELGGHTQLGHVARPGAAPLEEQLAAIPAGAWRLRDDDRATGATLRFVADALPAAVEIAGVDADPFAGEIADSRDFLLGTDEGGLVVALPDGTHGRAPYLLPYVDPGARAGVRDPVRFSRDVWALAAEALDGRMTDDLPDPAARVMHCAGRAGRLPDVCRWHARRLAAQSSLV